MFRLKVVGFKRINRLTQRGFNLVEIAIALVILALALGGVISAFAPQLANRGFTTTQAQLVEINEAILAFAAINGRLPCPATSTSNGRESFCTTAVGAPAQCVAAAAPPDGLAAMTSSRGRCSATPNFSYVPAVTLGLVGQGSSGTVVDAWGGTIQYVVTAVVNTNTNASPLLITPACGLNPFTCSFSTQTDGIKNAYGNLAVINQSDLFVCASATGIQPANCSLTPPNNQQATPAFIVFSRGRIRSARGTDEAPNTNADRVFVSHLRTDDDVPPPIGGFDDLFIWTTTSQLVARMLASKVLP